MAADDEQVIFIAQISALTNIKSYVLLINQ